jgi:hypothetical protein
MSASELTIGEVIKPEEKPKGPTYDGIKRPLYFTEQFLVVEDFRDEEYYHLGQMRRHNRTLHTPGAVAGLDVTVEENKPQPGKTTVAVTSGIAIDNFGREIILKDRWSDSFDTPTGDYSKFVVISFKEVTSKDDISKGGKQEVKRAVQAPDVAVIDQLASGSDQVVIYSWTRKSAVIKGQKVGAGARIPTGGALSFQQAAFDPANTTTTPATQARLDFTDKALRIRTGTDGGAGIDFSFDGNTTGIGAAGENQSLTIAAKPTGSLLINPDGGHVGIRTATLDLSDVIRVKRAIYDYPDSKVGRETKPGKDPDGKPVRVVVDATEGVYVDLDKNLKPRLVISGDVIILGRLLVCDISEFGGKIYQRGGSTG